MLRHRDTTPANSAAAEKIWKAIVDKQQGGGTRLKIPVKVISATPDVIEAAITDEAQAGNVADLHIAMARPLAPLPAVGRKIAIVGTLSDYQPQPFMFMMTRGELAAESMPVAGGPCADPRPQMCTRDYRPACGLRRDGTPQDLRQRLLGLQRSRRPDPVRRRLPVKTRLSKKPLKTGSLAQ